MRQIDGGCVHWRWRPCRMLAGGRWAGAGYAGRGTVRGRRAISSAGATPLPADDTFDLIQVRAGSELSGSPRVPDRLVAQQRLDQAEAVRTRRLELNGSSRINDQRMDLGRIDQGVTADTTEAWEVTNRSGNPHNFHVHDVQFQLVDYAGRPPPPHLTGWKDTVFLPPGATVRFLARFTDYTDPELPYMFHCHLLRHEDNGMMGQFVLDRLSLVGEVPQAVEDDPGDGGVTAFGQGDAEVGQVVDREGPGQHDRAVGLPVDGLESGSNSS